MGLCGSKAAAEAPQAVGKAMGKAAAGGDAASADKVVDGAPAHSFDREFHPDSTIWVFKERTPNVWDVYQKQGSIGEKGYYGKAYAAVHATTGELVVIKKINKRRHGYTKKMMQAYRREVATLRAVSHPNVVRLVDAFEDRDTFYIVMEHCSGGELYEHILKETAYTERKASAIFRQLLEGLRALHAQNLGHFDCKPSNCVFGADGRLKLIDFGMARFWQAAKRERFHSPAGTVQYSAPELLQRNYNLAADMWAAGVVLYVMLVGFPPFYASISSDFQNQDPAAAERARNRDIKKKILGGFSNELRKGYGPWFSTEKGVPQLSNGAMDLIARLLETDVKRRLTVDEALLHPWVQGEGDDAALDAPIAPLVHEALRKFTAVERFQQQVISLMADIVPDTEIAQLEKTFASMDTNGDNMVSVDEFKEAMRACGGAVASDEALQKLFDVADLDGNGSLCYEEVLSTLVHLKLTGKEERLYDAFTQLDRDGNGHVTVAELQHVLELEDPNEAEAMLRRVDTSQDGTVDYEEFLSVWRTEHTKAF